MLRPLLSLLLVLSMSTTLPAADVKELYEPRTFESDGKRLLYRLLKPKDYEAGTDKKYPLVIFFHGAGERGDDNVKQLVHGMKDFASDEVREKYPAFVVAPQCPAGKRWVDVSWSEPRHAMPSKPSPSMELSLGMLKALQKEFSIDSDRIYVTGLSMGGFGTWDAIQRHPDLFAAAAPICGGGDAAQAKRIARLPIWVFHGGDDGVVKPERSREMVEALKAAGGEPKYTEYPKVGHDSWSPTYSDPAFYEWLFSQKLK